MLYFWAKFCCSKWPNIEKIQSSGHTERLAQTRPNSLCEMKAFYASMELVAFKFSSFLVQRTTMQQITRICFSLGETLTWWWLGGKLPSKGNLTS